MSQFGILVEDDVAVTSITVPTPYPVGSVNMYLLEKDGFVVLIDAGVETQDAWVALQSAVNRRGLSLESIDAIFLTHHHEDHVGLVNRIVRNHPLPVYVHQRSIPRLTRDSEYLEGRLLFFEKLYERMGCGQHGARHIAALRNGLHSPDKVRLDGVNFCPVNEGDSIKELPNTEIHYVPGHAADHLMLFNTEANWLFSGDLLLPHVSSNAFVEPDEMTWNRMATVSLYRKSLLGCAQLPAERVFPGHGCDFGDHRDLIDHRLHRIDQKAERIRQIIALSPKSPMDICEMMYPSKIETQFPLVASEVMGLLDYLNELGQITIEEEDKCYICKVCDQ